MRLISLVALLLLCLLPLCEAEETCVPDAPQRSAMAAKATRNQLLAITAEVMDPAVPPLVKQKIHELKDSLVGTVSAYFACASRTEDPGKIQLELAKLLEANEPVERAKSFDDSIPDTERGDFGAALSIDVSTIVPTLLGVELSFGIECGEDTILLLYEAKSETWRKAVRWQSSDYDKASDAFGDFFKYSVVSNGPDSWVLAVAHGHPLCISRWSGFDVDVIAPATDNVPQRTLYHKSWGYVRDMEPVMKSGKEWFEIRVQTGSLDFEGVMIRPAIYHYRILGNEVRRVQPIAMNARDFVDEWLQSDWNEAKDWSAPINLSALEAEHSRITALQDRKTHPWPSFDYGPVRGCSDNPRRFQVEFHDRKAVYFLVEEGPNTFSMLAVSPTPVPHCLGPDLMRKSK